MSAQIRDIAFHHWPQDLARLYRVSSSPLLALFLAFLSSSCPLCPCPPPPPPSPLLRFSLGASKSLSSRRRVLALRLPSSSSLLPRLLLSFLFSSPSPRLSLSLSLSFTYITRAMLFHAWSTTGNRRSYRDYIHLRMLYRYTRHRLGARLSSKRRLFSLFFCMRARRHNIFSREIAQKRRVRDDASACVFSSSRNSSSFSRAARLYSAYKCVLFFFFRSCLFIRLLSAARDCQVYLFSKMTFFLQKYPIASCAFYARILYWQREVRDFDC